MTPIKLSKWGMANFECVFNWIIDLLLSDPIKMENNKRIKIIRKGAMIIFISYEKELIGKTNSPPYKEETLKEINNCRGEAIDLLDKFINHRINGNQLDENLIVCN